MKTILMFIKSLLMWAVAMIAFIFWLVYACYQYIHYEILFWRLRAMGKRYKKDPELQRALYGGCEAIKILQRKIFKA